MVLTNIDNVCKLIRVLTPKKIAGYFSAIAGYLKRRDDIVIFPLSALSPLFSAIAPLNRYIGIAPLFFR